MVDPLVEAYLKAWSLVNEKTAFVASPTLTQAAQAMPQDPSQMGGQAVPPVGMPGGAPGMTPDPAVMQQDPNAMATAAPQGVDPNAGAASPVDPNAGAQDPMMAIRQMIREELQAFHQPQQQPGQAPGSSAGATPGGASGGSSGGSKGSGKFDPQVLHNMAADIYMLKHGLRQITEAMGLPPTMVEHNRDPQTGLPAAPTEQSQSTSPQPTAPKQAGIQFGDDLADLMDTAFPPLFQPSKVAEEYVGGPVDRPVGASPFTGTDDFIASLAATIG